MPLDAVAYTELFVRHPDDPWRFCLAGAGYRPTGVRIDGADRYASVLQRGSSRILLAAVDPGGGAAAHVARHGEGIADVAFFVPDALPDRPAGHHRGDGTRRRQGP